MPLTTMDERISFYILFEEAEDGYYGDILVNRNLYNKDGVDAYIKENATKVFPGKETDLEHGIDCYFNAPSQNRYGTGLFYFQEFTR